MYKKLILPQALLIIKSKKCKEMENKTIALFIGILCLIFTGITNSKAQNQTTATNKYEIAVDLQNFFSDGTPDKVLFKLNNIKDNQIKGAYRFGIGATYLVDKYHVTQDDDNYELTGKVEKTNFSFSFGYEFQKQLNKAIFYYGADIGSYFSVTDDMDYPKTDDYFKLYLVPFAGVKILLTNNLSIAFETGIENKYECWKTEGTNIAPENRVKHTNYLSRIELPYSLTFNFNF